MLKISEVTMTGKMATLRLAGGVIGPWVGELRRSCEEALASGAALTLDLVDVSFVDADGVALFRELTRRRVVLRNCSAFVTERLKESDDE
jgi:ABC-type transporter Mla MlaB component